MDNKDELIISAPFDEFFNVLILKEAELEKKRQDLIKAGAIEKVNGQERVLLRKCAKYVLDELNLFRMKVMATHSYDDIGDYALTSLGYLRVWHCFLACAGSSRDTSRDVINNLKRELDRVLGDCQNIYEHLRTALAISLEINLSASSDNQPDQSRSNANNVPVNGQGKEHFIEDEDCATISIPLEEFTKMVKFGGSETEKRHQDLTEKVEIANINGKEYILLSRYIIFVLDDLEYLCLKAKTSRSEKTVEDYAFFSSNYLHIWTHILLGRTKFETPSGDKVPDDYIRSGWENALDYFQAIYRYTRDAIIISLENGPLASSKR